MASIIEEGDLHGMMEATKVPLQFHSAFIELFQWKATGQSVLSIKQQTDTVRDQRVNKVEQ